MQTVRLAVRLPGGSLGHFLVGACALTTFLCTTGCSLQRTFGIDAAGKLMVETYPTEPDRVQILRPPSDFEDAYRMLMFRCSAVEAEQTRVLRRAYYGRLILGTFTAAMGTASTTMVGINEVKDGGSYPEDSRSSLKSAAVITGGLAVLGSAILGIASIDNLMSAKTLVVQGLRQTKDAVRAQWILPGANRAELLIRLANACGTISPVDNIASGKATIEARASGALSVLIAANTKLARALDRFRELSASGKAQDAAKEMAELFRSIAADCKHLADEARALNLDEAVALAIAAGGALGQSAGKPDMPPDDVKRVLAETKDKLDAVSRVLTGSGGVK